MAGTRLRLDQWLVAHGFAETRSRAQWLIETGQVWVRGQPCRKASVGVADASQVELRGEGLPYVSRGGLKLERALQVFAVNVAGLVALDVGASTGGFTDCLLQHGVERVYALDVGTGQLVSRLREDPRVISLEGRNVRTFQAAGLPEAVALITVDVSFISLTRVLPLLPPFLQPHGCVIALVKPQFEVGTEHVGRGGIVRDPACQALALCRVMTRAEEAGLQVEQTVEAPCLHTHGNQEVFIHLRWTAERVALAARRQPPPALNVPPQICKPASGIHAGERG
jgi:23S rRNA (cytidine1920-2'-O)/16S rRNA (cytidine1409-2'-O)-methyltransferase